MPELPEVEAARRGLVSNFVGRSLENYDLNLPKIVNTPTALTLSDLTGRRLNAIERHGKYLTLVFGDLAAIVHLKLSGQLVGIGPDIEGFHAGHPVPAWGTDLPHKSTHLTLHFSGGARVYLTDIRQFARVTVLPTEFARASVADLHLGPDAIGPEFTATWMRTALKRRRNARLKPLLLDQTFLAGLGNIYVDESLWAAKLHPERTAGSLSVRAADGLYSAIVGVLEVAVPIGGAAVLNGKALPMAGQFPFVHGRKGEPCPRCGSAITKIRVGGRGTYLCPVCQPAPA